MRFTSSWRSAVAALLCGPLALQGVLSGSACAADAAAEAALLLKYASPGIPDATARTILDPLPSLLQEELHVRWVPVPQAPAGAPTRLPSPDDAALRRIAGKLSAAISSMEKVETAAAASLLAEAEGVARSYRFDDSTRPFLSEIFIRRGMLSLWEGDAAAAESYLARSRALRPDFSPDPALFSPQFLAAWRRAGAKPVPEAELLVRSMPPGAAIFVDRERRGTTPSRVRISTPGPRTIRLSHPGYRDATRDGQWLPGDQEILDFTLEGDRVTRLGEILGDPRGGSGSGSILAEVAAAAGTGKVAVLLLSEGDAAGTVRARLYDWTAGGGDAVPLGEETLARGGRAANDAAKWAAQRLRSSGWPPAPRREDGRAWYRSVWFWAAVISVGVVAAIAAGGSGGGGSGSDTGTVAVNF
jgi:hypothetical protein